MRPERMVDANGVRLCVQTFGDPADPPVLLIHGACASMLWWEQDLCAQLAARHRHVIRYDSRDTGRSTAFPVGRDNYGMSHLAADAVAVLDALELPRAHIVGRSMGGAVALTLGVDHPERVATLTFLSTTSEEPDLPPPDPDFLASIRTQPDLSNVDEVVEHLVHLMRAHSGGSPYFDEAATRALAVQDVARTTDLAAMLANHFELDLDAPRNGGFGDITAPTLVVHGDLDPLFPLPHGESLRRAIPGAELLVLPGAGHDLPRALWPRFIDALVAHTA